jgi:hypothetical protein
MLRFLEDARVSSPINAKSETVYEADLIRLNDNYLKVDPVVSVRDCIETIMTSKPDFLSREVK